MRPCDRRNAAGPWRSPPSPGVHSATGRTRQLSFLSPTVLTHLLLLLTALPGNIAHLGTSWWAVALSASWRGACQLPSDQLGPLITPQLSAAAARERAELIGSTLTYQQGENNGHLVKKNTLLKLKSSHTYIYMYIYINFTW